MADTNLTINGVRRKVTSAPDTRLRRYPFTAQRVKKALTT